MTARRLVPLACVLALAGCGIDAQSSPTPVPISGLTAPTPAVSPTPTSAVVVPREVFFVRNNRLVAAERRLPIDSAPTSGINALLAGPTEAEAASGLTTALPAGVRLDVEVTGTVAVIRVPHEFEQLSGAEQVLALAQLVYTATASDGITGVQLTDGNHPIDVPTDAGRLAPGPVTRADYRELAPTNGR